jgi:hypothetical protein
MDNDSRTDSAGAMLLSDLKDLFDRNNNSESLATREILDRLHEMDDRPWPAWGRLNKPITSDALARLLKPFKVKPQQIKALGGKGYWLADLLDAFDRYIPTQIPTPPLPSRNPETHKAQSHSQLKITRNQKHVRFRVKISQNPRQIRMVSRFRPERGEI